MKVTIEGQELVIRVPARLRDPPRSASGKTLLVASETDKNTVQVLGKGLTVAINAYIKA